MSTGNPPVKVFRSGKVQCSIWASTTQHGVMYNVTMVRRYQVNQEWQSSPSMNADDLGTMALLAQTAFQWIMKQRDQQRTQANGNGQTDSMAGTQPQGASNNRGNNRGAAGNHQQGPEPAGGYFAGNDHPADW